MPFSNILTIQIQSFQDCRGISNAGGLSLERMLLNGMSYAFK
jgi:hypothetical protein